MERHRTFVTDVSQTLERGRVDRTLFVQLARSVSLSVRPSEISRAFTSETEKSLRAEVTSLTETCAR